MKDALVKSKRKLDPTLFAKPTSTSLTKDEEKSEVNWHFAWGIFSSMKRLKDKRALKLLGDMKIRLDKVDDYYFKHFYDSSVSLLNSGGYTLTAGWIFPYALTLMSELRAQFSMDKMNMDPKNSFGVAKNSII